MSSSPTPLEQPIETSTARRRISLGLPACAAPTERRFPITPECVSILTERGIDVFLEDSAAEVIHFSNEDYRRAGAAIVNRVEALTCDIVLHIPAISPDDAQQLKKGAVLLSLLHLESQTPAALQILLDRHIIAIALDLVTDENNNRPFADILSEIEGRAAMAIASSLLADAVHGKGILLGGVAGIVPCEVTIIGSDITARAAALSAIGLGATVRMFDNDTYSLRDALLQLGQSSIIGSALHPRVFANALRSADIVVATPTRYNIEVGADIVAEMKRGVIAFDLTGNLSRPVFPTLRRIDLAAANAADCPTGAHVRVCYVNAGSAVPRTAAMALSTTLLTLFEDIIVCDGLVNAIKLKRGLSRAVYAFMGKPVNDNISQILGQRPFDISLFLQFS